MPENLPAIEKFSDFMQMPEKWHFSFMPDCTHMCFFTHLGPIRGIFAISTINTIWSV